MMDVAEHIPGAVSRSPLRILVVDDTPASLKHFIHQKS